jgi:hypothetical protein
VATASQKTPLFSTLEKQEEKEEEEEEEEAGIYKR